MHYECPRSCGVSQATISRLAAPSPSGQARQAREEASHSADYAVTSAERLARPHRPPPTKI